MTAALPFDIPDAELQWRAVRSSGPGGQNVNKVASAVQLRFNYRASTVVDEATRARLDLARDQRIRSNDGEILIHAERFASQARNLEDAVARLQALLARYATAPKPRRATRPSKASIARRLDDKRAVKERKQARRIDL